MKKLISNDDYVSNILGFDIYKHIKCHSKQFLKN